MNSKPTPFRPMEIPPAIFTWPGIWPLVVLVGISAVWAPAPYLAAAYCGLHALLARQGFLRNLGSSDRNYLLNLTLAAFLMRLAAVLFFHFSSLGHDGFYFLDDRGFHDKGLTVMGFWRDGRFPPLYEWTPIGLGTFHVGFIRIIAACYYAFGVHPLIPKLIGAAVGSFLPMLLFAAAGLLGLAVAERRLVALFGALYPNLILWGSFLLKDAWISTLLVGGCVGALCLLRRPITQRVIVGVTAVLWILCAFRIYLTLGILLGLLLYGIAGLNRKEFLRWLRFAIVLLLVANVSPFVRWIEERIVMSFVISLPLQYRDPLACFSNSALAVPRFLLGSYAWVFFGNDPIIFVSYPGQWLLYLVIYPLFFAGLIQVFRANDRRWLIVLAPLAVSLLVYLAAYGGAAPRQRAAVEPLILLVAALGLRSSRLRSVWVVWLAALILFIVAHLLSLQ
ncbi:MAG: hypothetical protein V2A74_05215 [bacterium]